MKNEKVRVTCQVTRTFKAIRGGKTSTKFKGFDKGELD